MVRPNDMDVILASDYTKIYDIAKQVRSYMEDNYGTGKALLGRCDEAANILHKKLNENGIRNDIIEGWVLVENDSYESHTWIETDTYLIDVTGDQFEEFKDIDLIDEFKPIFIVEKNSIDRRCYVYEEPNYDEYDEDDEDW